MTQTGGDTHTPSYNTPTYNIAQAAIGQVWRLTYWARGSVTMVIEGGWIAEANSAGSYLAGGGSLNPTITTSWQKFTTSYTLTQATSAFVQVRLDGSNTYSGTPSDVWFDLINLERVS